MLESRNVDHRKSNCSDITVSSVFHNYFNFVLMLESQNMDPLKNNFSCVFFVKNSGVHHSFLKFSKLFKDSPHTTIAIEKCKSVER